MLMRSCVTLLLGLALFAAGCAKPSNDRQYTLQGQVLSIAADRMEATIKHEEIKGLMPAHDDALQGERSASCWRASSPAI